MTQKQIDRILLKNPNTKAYIKKGGWFYKSNHCGYTENIVEAGIYSLEEAWKTVKPSTKLEYMDLIIIEEAEHNKIIIEKIKDLSTRLI